MQKLDRKIVQLKSHSIVVSPTVRFGRHIVLPCVPVCPFDFGSQIMSTLVNVKKLVSMVGKYHNHTLQTNPRYSEEEPQNIYSNKTSVRQ